ncbi:hypothetical protein NDU88_005388 [Pleurodeles waltl]|uniref:Uncharacterized protein n=1 Tax=Pleurodeles waltl TaxID=8319 RepID=A0AAV7UI00_PLEWA|nr:hypothetical protein NDU88_005388 [Pleurodeles waltl]
MLLVARSHGPFQTGDYEVCITVDFSKEINNCRKAFLSLRPRLRKLDVKYGPFGADVGHQRQNFQGLCEPEDLQLFLDTLSPQVMDTTPMTDYWC